MTITPSQQNNNFLNLSDTPNSYSGQGSKLVAVNDTATSLAFGSIPTAVYSADTPPINPSIYDDEFDGTTLNTNKWSWMLAGAPSSGVESYGVSKGKVWATVGWDGGEYGNWWPDQHVLYQVAPNASFTITTKVNAYQAIGGMYGIYMSSDYVDTTFYYRGYRAGIGYRGIDTYPPTSLAWTNNWSIKHMATGCVVSGKGCYIKMVWDNSTKTASIYSSLDGYSWWCITFAGYDQWIELIPQRFGLMWWARCTSDKTPHVDRGGASFDFFRVTLP